MIITDSADKAGKTIAIRSAFVCVFLKKGERYQNEFWQLVAEKEKYQRQHAARHFEVKYLETNERHLKNYYQKNESIS